MDSAKALVKGHRAYEKVLVEMLVFMDCMKDAVKIVNEFGLNPGEFPHLVQHASFNAANYFVSQCFREP